MNNGNSTNHYRIYPQGAFRGQVKVKHIEEELVKIIIIDRQLNLHEIHLVFFCAAKRELYQQEKRAAISKTYEDNSAPFWHLKEDGIGKTPRPMLS